MELTYETLIKFDLIKKLENNLIKNEEFGALSNLSKVIEDIQGTDQFIKGLPSYPSSTDKIVRDELVSAVGATLAIEGTVLREDEIEESFRKASLNETLKREEQEAENSRKVYQFIIELKRNNSEQFIFTEQVIKQIHKLFTENMNYLGNEIGAYRSNFVATFGYPRRGGLCKTFAEIEVAMKNFVKWLNKDNETFFLNNPFSKAIMAHYYLSEIHPFADGNGRTARALEALILYVNGINDYCFWSLANFWSLNRSEYIAQLGNIRNTSKPYDFIIWGLNGYLGEISRFKSIVLKKVKQLMLMDYARYLLENKNKQKIKINQRIVDTLRVLIGLGTVPFGTFQNSPQISSLYKTVSYVTKHRDIIKMQQVGLISFLEENKKVFIEPRFKTLESLTYNI